MENVKGALGKSALNQILLNQKKPLKDSERNQLVKKIESSCIRFDKTGKGKLSADEFYNVIKIQNKIDCSKDDIAKMIKDLDPDKEHKVSIKVKIAFKT